MAEREIAWERSVREVSADEVATFEQTGAMLLPGLVEREAALRLGEEAGNCIAGSGFRMGAGMIDFNPLYNGFVFGSRIAEAGGRLMQARRVRLYVDNLFVKDPMVEEPLNWHNDLPYYPFANDRVASIWIALCDVDPEMSPLELVPGSHKWGKWFKPHIFSAAAAVKERVENIDLEPCPNFSELAEKYPGAVNVLKWPMRAGDAIAFTGLTVHHSGSNRSPDKRRIGYSLRWLAEDAIWDPRPNTLYEQAAHVLRAGEPVDDFFPLLWRADGGPTDDGRARLSRGFQESRMKSLAGDLQEKRA